MITRELQATLNLAANEAIKRRHEFLTLEHLLFAMLHDETASEVLLQCGIDLDLLRRDLEEFFTENMTPLPRGVERYPEQTAAFERVIDRAILQAQASAQDKVDGGNTLASLFEEHHSHAKYLLEKQGVSKLDILNYISHGISKVDDGESLPLGGEDEDELADQRLDAGQHKPRRGFAIADAVGIAREPATACFIPDAVVMARVAGRVAYQQFAPAERPAAAVRGLAYPFGRRRDDLAVHLAYTLLAVDRHRTGDQP